MSTAASTEFWHALQASFQDTLVDGEGDKKHVDALKFCEACLQIGVLYDSMFSVGAIAGQLKADIQNSSKTVKTACDSYKLKGTVQELLAHEFKIMKADKIRYDKKTGTIGLLWAKRAVEFIAVYLRLLATRADLTSGACAKETYEMVLRRYHGMITGGFVKVGLGMAPNREDVYIKMGLGTDKKKSEEMIHEMITVLDEVVASIQECLDKFEADFPDKV